MKPLNKAIFSAAATAVMLMTPTVGHTETPASENVTQASSTALQVQFLSVADLTKDGAALVAASASRDKVAIVVWGGNRALQQEAFNAAHDLVSVGIPAAFVLAPDHNSLSGDAVLQVYAGSKPYSDGQAGSDNADQVRPMMRARALEAHQETFAAPQLTLR